MGGRNIHLGDEGRLGYSAASRSKVAEGARTRGALLLASALGCSLSIFVTATPAAAIPVSNDACGSITASTGAVTVTCTATSGTGNNYPNGIVYVPTQPVDLTVVLQGGTSGAVSVNSSGNGVFVWGAADHAATVTTYAGANITAARVGIDLTTSGTGVASINNAATVSGTPGGLSAISNGTGGASVTNSGAITVGADPGFGQGILALSTGGTASVTNSGAITANTGATYVTGINIAAAGAQTVNNNAGGTISVTATDTAAGIGTYSMSPSSTVTINNAAAVAATSTGATGSAFGIQSDSSQAAVVDLTGASAVTANGYHATGVEVRSYGDVTVTGATGTTIAANGSGGQGAGVFVSSQYGTATIKVDSVSTTGANTSGVYVRSYHGPTIEVGHTANGKAYGVVTSGDGATGVQAGSYDGQITVTNHGLIQTSGANANGVNAFSANAAVAVNTDAASVLDTKGLGSIGVNVGSTYGAATVTNAGAITTEGNNAAGVIVTTGQTRGKYAVGTGTASIVNTGSIVTKGANSAGAYAAARDGVASISSTSVTTWGDNSVGLHADGKYGAVVTTGAVTTHGANSTAVLATSGGVGPAAGYTTVHVTGAIVTSGANSLGVSAASSFGPLVVDGSGSITTSGANSTGVRAAGKYGATVDVTGAISATGAGSFGVDASSDGPGGTTVTVGKVTADSTAVHAYGGFAADVTVNGAVTSIHGLGVDVSASSRSEGSGTNATVTVSHGGSVTGATGGVRVAGYYGAAVTNHGVIGSKGGFAADVTSQYGAATVVNAADGVINGAVRITGYNGSTFTNAGVWNASGDSTFAPAMRYDRVAGVVSANLPAGPVIDNTGTMNVAPTATSPVTVTVTGVSAFNNAGGVVDMRNGHGGDVLNLGGAAFNATGASRLAVDVDFTPGGKADKLVAGQASGTTAVIVQDVNGGGGGINLTGVTVAQAASGTPAGAFVLGTTRTGFVNYSLTFDPTSTSWNLVGLPSHAVFETLKLPQLAQGFAERSDDVWFQRMQEVRDASARKDGFEFWGQVYGGEQNVGQARTFAFGGGSFNEDLSTKSTWGGVQFGVDHLASWRSGRLLWGFTAGYLEQSSQFIHSGGVATWANGQLIEAARPKDSIEVKGANLGGYLGYTQGGWFLNGLAKVDFGGVNAKLNSIQLNAATNATVWGVNGELGYRFGGQSLFVEPVIRLSGGDTNVDRLVGAGASTTYPDATNLLATAGARVGGQAAAGSVTLSPWLGAYVADELLGQNRAGFTVAGTTIDLRDQPVRTFARFDVGATVKSGFGVEGFAKAGADTGSGVSGWTANLGVRWRW